MAVPEFEPEATTPLVKASPARARILATADRLFYAEGIRAVGVDRVVAEAQVTRVTFYRHFPSKDELIAAYLAGRLQRDQAQFAELRRAHSSDPAAVLQGVADLVVTDFGAPGFRGCPYLNLAAEYCDADHPARRIGAEHRLWLRGVVQGLLTELGHPRAAIVAEQLVMLRAGVMALTSTGGDAGGVEDAFTEAWNALLDG